jgi:hypothetical protein
MITSRAGLAAVRLRSAKRAGVPSGLLRKGSPAFAGLPYESALLTGLLIALLSALAWLLVLLAGLLVAVLTALTGLLALLAWLVGLSALLRLLGLV